jgi:peptidyl-prolyl cis-trans isomerase SurA
LAKRSKGKRQKGKREKPKVKARKVKGCVTAFVLAALASVSAVSRAEIIDRILAVVNGAIIMQSDVNMAVRLALVPGASASDPISAPLDALIERRLILEEVDRYAPPDPPDAEIDRHLADVRTRAGARFDLVLVETGISAEQLRRYLRDDVRMEAYLQQRFGTMQPTDHEIAQYYRDHQAALTRNGTVAPLEDVRDVVRAELMAERRSTTIRDWIAGLRRRANVNVLPR